MLYNVTFELEDRSTTLIPYIPYNAAPDEDRVTKRVCLADSIEHCIEAMGFGIRDINMYEGGLIVVRSVDETKLDPSKIFIPEELYDTRKVPDALETNEHWYVDKVGVKREVYEIVKYDYEYAIAFTCIEASDMADIIERYDVTLMGYETAEEAFDRVIDELLADGRWNEIERLENDIYALPWAKKIKITNLILKEVKQEDYAKI